MSDEAIAELRCILAQRRSMLVITSIALVLMQQRRAPNGVRAELLATAMVDYEKSLGGNMTASHEEWTLVYYFREYPPRSVALSPRGAESHAAPFFES